jgi:hypothetical protein
MAVINGVNERQSPLAPGGRVGDCAPVVENSLAATIHCVGSFQSLANQPVWFQFELTNAQLYAFHLEP